MKIFLASAICFFLPLSGQLATSQNHMRFCDRENIVHYMKERKKEISFLLSTYEIEGSEPKFGFDYHMGYLQGKHSAFNEILLKMND